MTPPGQKHRYDFFVSYSHEDERWAREVLLKHLEEHGLKGCIDTRDFEPGAPVQTNIEAAISQSRHVLVVATPSWVESQWTDFEQLLAMHPDPANRTRKLIPLLREKCALPKRLEVLTYLDFTRSERESQEFERLVNQLRGSPVVYPAPVIESPPFIAGPPIRDPRRFFGRTRILPRLFNLWKRPPLQNAAIIGPKRSGKTSLLLHLKELTRPGAGPLRPSQRADWLPGPERYRWIFVDFQDPRVGTREGLLRHLLSSLGLSTESARSMDHFMNAVSHGLRAPTIVLMDEIGVALHRHRELDDSFWEGMRALATSQVEGNLAFVLSAHESPAQIARESRFGSPFFNIFGYTAQLGPFSEAEARELISSSPHPFPEADIEWILRESGCWPLLLQILCRERLVTLESGESDEDWREEAARQLAAFPHLRGTR